MTDKEIDEILQHAAAALPGGDAAEVDRVAESLGPALRPVRSMPRTHVLVSLLIFICLAIAGAGAARAGLAGVMRMGLLERATIFPVLVLLVWLVSAEFVGQMIPGSRHFASPRILLGAGSIALLTTFALLFHDYGTERFLHQGLVCLLVGLLHAIPAAIGIWLAVRRGYAVQPMTAGLMAGSIGGLAGLTMLELHCANFEAPHILLWHMAVVAISAGAGAWVGWRWPGVFARLGS